MQKWVFRNYFSKGLHLKDHNDRKRNRTVKTIIRGICDKNF